MAYPQSHQSQQKEKTVMYTLKYKNVKVQV